MTLDRYIVTEQKTEQMMKLLAQMKAGHEEMMAEMRVCREVTEAYSEKMEANPEETKSVAEHWELPKEEATVETIGSLKTGLETGIWPQGATDS
jgi:hypothetical protein